MKARLLDALKSHRAITNLGLSFGAAVLASIWVNIFTSQTSSGDTLPSHRFHLLLIAAVALIVLQGLYNRWVEKLPPSALKDLLELTCRFLTDRANALHGDVHGEDIRAFFHVPSKVKAGDNHERELCLVAVGHFCPRPRDRGPIPIKRDEYAAWYVNVRAFTTRCIVSEEPDMARKPSGDDLYINTPTQFSSKSVLSIPVWRQLPRPEVAGVITCDSPCSLAELNWPDTRQARADATHRELCEALKLIADLVSKVNWVEETTN